MNEVKRKIQACRDLMRKHGLSGIRFKGVDWFSWATAGGSSVVIFTSEIGVAEVFLTFDHAWILTNQIERDRIAKEEAPSEFELMAFPWENKDAPTEFVQKELKNQSCASDRPTGNESPLPFDFQKLKMSLSSEEIERYRALGKSAAEAMTEALMQAESNWTERQLAGAGSEALWKRGIDPTLVMVGSERRVQIYRHPIATDDRLGDFAMMVFCGRQFGLYANLTRFIFFREPTEEERKKFHSVAQVEAAAFASSKPGTKLKKNYEALADAYAQLGCPEEIHRHHQGGPTGYLSREQVASSFSPAQYEIQNSMALAWNPSLPGAKIEDTVLTTENGIEILTVDPKWPTLTVQGRARPDIWIQK